MSHLCNCGQIATLITAWRTSSMPASSFWYDCAACVVKTHTVLAQDPNATFTTRALDAPQETPCTSN